jgi:hypothetical protein
VRARETRSLVLAGSALGLERRFRAAPLKNTGRASTLELLEQLCLGRLGGVPVLAHSRAPEARPGLPGAPAVTFTCRTDMRSTPSR